MPSEENRAIAQRLLVENNHARWPRGLNKNDEVAGVMPVLIETYVVGCISTWLSQAGPLDEWRRGVLEECCASLDRFLPFLADEYQTQYFERLRHLAVLALE